MITSSADENVQEPGSQALLVGVENGASTLKTVWEFLKMLSICLPYMLPSQCVPKRNESRCPYKDLYTQQHG